MADLNLSLQQAGLKLSKQQIAKNFEELNKSLESYFDEIDRRMSNLQKSGEPSRPITRQKFMQKIGTLIVNRTSNQTPDISKRKQECYTLPGEIQLFEPAVDRPRSKLILRKEFHLDENQQQSLQRQRISSAIRKDHINKLMSKKDKNAELSFELQLQQTEMEMKQKEQKDKKNVIRQLHITRKQENLKKQISTPRLALMAKNIEKKSQLFKTYKMTQNKSITSQQTLPDYHFSKIYNKQKFPPLPTICHIKDNTLQLNNYYLNPPTCEALGNALMYYNNLLDISFSKNGATDDKAYFIFQGLYNKQSKLRKLV